LNNYGFKNFAAAWRKDFFDKLKRRPDGRRFFAILRFLNPIEQFRQREADIARDDMYSSVLRFPTLK
jgi:hypothetical protein